MIAIATKDFRANNSDVKKGDLCKIEDEYVIVNDQYFCHIESVGFQAYFELVE